MVRYTRDWNIAFKTWKPPWKIWKYKIDILYILKKKDLEAERKVHSTRYSCFTQDIATFNELVDSNLNSEKI